ncbi:MAG: hypothetical protein IKL28_10320 [Lachnospiraceae bacterium]|nr:hypothetical protein [Lachnospiraceae bacterium]
MSEERQVKFKYVFDDNYSPVYCNGSYGGVSTNGEIIANFFLERMPIPKSITNEVNPDGTLSGIREIEPEDMEKTVIRHVNTGIILTEKSAMAIYEWLGSQIQELKNRKALLEQVQMERE